MCQCIVESSGQHLPFGSQGLPETMLVQVTRRHVEMLRASI